MQNNVKTSVVLNNKYYYIILVKQNVKIILKSKNN